VHGTELVFFVKGSDEWQLEEPLLFFQCACRHLLHAPDFADRNRRNVSHILCDKVQSYFDFLDSFRNLGVIANNFESYHLTSEVVDLGEHKRYSRLIVAPMPIKPLVILIGIDIVTGASWAGCVTWTSWRNTFLIPLYLERHSFASAQSFGCTGS
jgi:hypothetical protein